jgi:very-short-patch-repair endonuclease
MMMPQGALEARFITWVLPLLPIKPVEQYAFHPTRRWRFDYAWPSHWLAVECDGGQWQAHGGRHNTDADREKLNAAAILGWRVLRYSGAMLNDPESVAEEIKSALAIDIPDMSELSGIE